MIFVRLFVLVVSTLLVGPAIAIDYAIQFDLGADHPKSSSGPDMKSASFNWYRFRSVGWDIGGLFKNATGKEIKAIHIKVTHPRTSQNPTGDLLAISSPASDNLFDTIWVKDDHTEVLFTFSSSTGKIAKNGVIWNKITKSTAEEIKKCKNNGEEICPLAGKLFDSPQQPPSGEKWTKIKSPVEAKLWGPLSVLPRRYQKIDVYSLSDDEKYVVFVSRNRVLAYDFEAESAFYIDEPSMEPEGINRIGYEDNQFVLYRSGEAGTRFTPGEWNITEIEDVEPTP